MTSDSYPWHLPSSGVTEVSSLRGQNPKISPWPPPPDLTPPPKKKKIYNSSAMHGDKQKKKKKKVLVFFLWFLVIWNQNYVIFHLLSLIFPSLSPSPLLFFLSFFFLPFPLFSSFSSLFPLLFFLFCLLFSLSFPFFPLHFSPLVCQFFPLTTFWGAACPPPQPPRLLR